MTMHPTITSGRRMSGCSPVMRFFRAIGRDRLAWALRRFYVPVPKNALVLEVGSGGNPYPRANVLVDAYEETRERHWVPLTADRPMVLGFVENLPFKDKSFDYVIASHVLEHSPFPEKFLFELQRVAKAGYIETPDAYMERTNPYRDHRLEVTVRNEALVIRKKPAWLVDDDLVELYEAAAKRHITRETIPSHPFDFHVRYYWNKKINFSVQNPEVDAGWEPPVSATASCNSQSSFGWRTRLMAMLRRLFSQGTRNRHIDLLALLRCPSCGSDQLYRENDKDINCRGCGKRYPIRRGIPVMTELVA